MKKLLLALLCVSSVAIAEPVAYMPNNSGGRIVLTNEICTGKDGKKYDQVFRIYTYSDKGDTAEGCFIFEGDTVRVFWPSAQKESRYELKNFELYNK